MHKAHCHDQEYWVVRRNRCKCNAAFNRASVFAQRMQHGPAGAVDIVDLRCEHCGDEHCLEFDISPFFGRPDIRAFRELLQEQDRLWEMYVWSELKMEAMMKYLSELAEGGESLAIEYISDATRHFLAKAKKSSEAAE